MDLDRVYLFLWNFLHFPNALIHAGAFLCCRLIVSKERKLYGLTGLEPAAMV
jgi:hypothetical protein